MNKKGQTALKYLMTYGWALIVIAIFIACFIYIIYSPNETPSEFWKEEWTCTKEIETGELENCREEKTENIETKILDFNMDKNINIPYCEYLSEKLGEWFYGDLKCNYKDGKCWSGTIECKKYLESTTEIVCGKAKKCVQQARTRCLIKTVEECDSQFPIPYCKPLPDIRLCEQEAGK